MRKFISLIILMLCSSVRALHAQNVDMDADIVTKVLCKRWKLDYFIYDGMKIFPKPGEKFGLDFMPNSTFNFIESDPNQKYNQKNKYTWRFDSLKKVILLKTDVDYSEIISLTNDELIMLTDTKSKAPEDTAGIKTYYIPQKSDWHQAKKTPDSGQLF